MAVGVAQPAIMVQCTKISKQHIVPNAKVTHSHVSHLQPPLQQENDEMV